MRAYIIFFRRHTMQETDKAEFKVFKIRNRGLGMGIGLLAAFLFLFMLAPGADAYECIDCHGSSGPHEAGCQNMSCGTSLSCHPNKLDHINHLSGAGTPLAGDLSSAEGITTVCKTCHVGPNTSHPFIINTDPVIITAATDLNFACGQCHGGGTSAITNPPKAGIPYRSKASLADVAKGMHASAGVNYPVSFTYTIGSPDTLIVAFFGSVCSPGDTVCLNRTFTYDWDFGDGTIPHGTGVTPTHAYTLAGTYSVKLTVSLATGGIVGSVSRSMTIDNPDLPPTAAGTCSWDPNTWTMNVLDSSSDDGPDADALPGDGNATLQISVDWGDSSSKSFGGQGGPFSHTYIRTGPFTVTLKAIDSKLQSSTYSCSPGATPAYFTIGGTVIKGATAVGSATVQLYKQNTTTLAYVIQTSKLSAADGSFSFGSLKPGNYKLKVIKTGITFPETLLKVGPSSISNVINGS
jgi:hypothetical protein